MKLFFLWLVSVVAGIGLGAAVTSIVWQDTVNHAHQQLRAANDQLRDNKVAMAELSAADAQLKLANNALLAAAGRLQVEHGKLMASSDALLRVCTR